MVGLLAVQAVSSLRLLTFTTQADKRGRPLVEGLAFGPCSDNYPIEIRRKSVQLVGHIDSELVLYLSNRTDEPLRLSFDHLGNLTDVAVENDSRYSPGMSEKTLAPYGTFIFSAEKYDRDPQVVSVSYRSRDSNFIHRFAAYFSDSNPTPTGCAFN
jgi:hypothetical protein